jgi:phospholipid/cholesterol/gamma-HCH transport system permease protein
MFVAVGRRALVIFIAVHELAQLLFGAFRSLLATLRRGGRPVARVFLKQVYFTGNEALQVLFIIAMAVGIAMVSQMSHIADYGRGSLIGKLFVWVVIREVAPLVTALVVIARSGSAIATELGQMKLGGEIEAIEALGIPGEHYLLMPRIFGVAVALFVLNIYFSLVAVTVGLLCAGIGWEIPLAQIRQGIFSEFTLKELVVAGVKSGLFGMVIAAVSCRAGLFVENSVTQIPQAGTRAVMLSLILVFVLDVALSLTFLF